MDYVAQINAFTPGNQQEASDKRLIIELCHHFSHSILLRENEHAHITSSGFIVNRSLDKALMVHHNIRNTWSWTGGHADGDPDLLGVAIREAQEETGAALFTPLSDGIATVDVFDVGWHQRKSKDVCPHMHLSIAYLLIGDEDAHMHINPDENTQVAWFPLDYFTQPHFDDYDVYLYNKLIDKARGAR